MMAVLLLKNGTAFQIAGEAEIFAKDNDFIRIISSASLIKNVLAAVGKDSVIMGNLGEEIQHGLYADKLVYEDTEYTYREGTDFGFYAKL